MRPGLLAAALVLAAGCRGGAGGSGSADAAHRLYSEGKFEEAEVLLRGRRDPLSLRLLGRILLFLGRNAEAADVLGRIPQPADAPPDLMSLQDLFWAHYRQDDFHQAARVAASAGDGLLSAKYAQIARRGAPYAASWRSDFSTQRIEQGNRIYLRVNGQAAAVGVDWGSGEMVLAPEFAKSARVQVIGPGGADFGGGEQGLADSVEASQLAVRNVPVVIRPLKDIQGTVGVAFLSHFLVTWDGTRTRLILQPPRPTPSSGGLPLYLAGDRNLFCRAEIDGTPALIVLNPGLPKTFFVPSPALLMDRASRGLGGPIRSVRLGPVDLSPPPADSTDFPPGLDRGFGFEIAGLLGAQAFEDRAWTFDFKQGRMLVE